MASAWGKSFGFSWGNSWGTVTPIPVVIVDEGPHGGSGKEQIGINRKKILTDDNLVFTSLAACFIMTQSNFRTGDRIVIRDKM